MALSKTLGVGGDFTDIGDLFNEYKEGTAGMPDDIEVTQISDFTEATGCDTSTYMIFNNHKLTIRNPDGYDITITDWTKHYQIFARDAAEGDELEIDGLNVYLPFYNNPQTLFNFRGIYYSNAVKSTYKNISIYGQGGAGTGAIGILIGNAYQNKSDVLNCRVYNTLVGIQVGLSSFAYSGVGQSVVENCAVYGCGTGAATVGVNTSAASATTFKNTVCHENTTADFSIGLAGASAYQSIINCADSDNSIASADATLSGNITGIVDGDFLSVTSTDADFLYIDKNSTLFNAGSKTLSDFNTADIDGKNRPYQGRVSIGINEPEAPMVPTFQKLNLLLAKNQSALGTKAPSALTISDQSAVDDTFALDYVKEFQDQNLAQAIFGQPQAVGGQSYVDVKVTMPIIPTGSSTVPNVGRYLNCCGMLYALASKKHSWTPSSAVNTAWKDMSLNAYTGDKVAGDSILTKAHSAMFDAEISGEVGKPVMCTFTGKGVPDGVPAAATYLTDNLTPISTQTPAMLKNATQTINGIAFTMLKFSLKTGNDVQLIKSASDDSGNLQSMITGRQSVLTTTVYMEDQSAKNPLTGMAAGTLATTTIKFGNATDYLISLTSGSNKSEIRSAKMSVDNGLMCWDLEIRFVDNNYTFAINDAA